MMGQLHLSTLLKESLQFKPVLVAKRYVYFYCLPLYSTFFNGKMKIILVVHLFSLSLGLYPANKLTFNANPTVITISNDLKSSITSYRS